VYRTNVNATFNVLSQVGQRGVRRASIASSINAFGVPLNHHDVTPAYFPIDEDIPTDIDDWYSLSKRSDELTAAMVARHWGTTVVALRFPLVKSADELRRHARRLATDPRQAMREGWAHLDVRDAARALLAGLTAPLIGAHVLLVAAEVSGPNGVPRPTVDGAARRSPGVAAA